MLNIAWVLLLAVQPSGTSETLAQKVPPPITPPLVAYQIGAPVFTLEAVRWPGRQGTVVVSAVVTAGGTTRDVIAKVTLVPLLAKTCEAAVEHTRFEPRPGAPDVPVSFTFTFTQVAQSASQSYAVCEPCPFTWRIASPAPPTLSDSIE